MIRPLSEQQKKILQLIADGHTNEQIATKLRIAVATVKTHRMQIKGRIEAKNTYHMITIGFRNGWIE